MWSELKIVIRRVAKRGPTDNGGETDNGRETDSGGETGNGRRGRVQLLLEIAAYFAIAVFLLTVDVFGFGEYTSKRSQDYLIAIFLGDWHASSAGRQEANVLFAPDRSNGHCDGREGGDCVAVVLLGDKSLEYFGVSWPMPFEVHGKILRSILSYKPKAVLTDFLFIDERKLEGQQSTTRPDYIQKVIALYERYNTPLYLLGNHLDPEAPYKAAFLSKELGKNGAMAEETVRITWAPLRLDLGVARQYKSHAEFKGAPPSFRSENGHLTAAFRVWQDICLSGCTGPSQSGPAAACRAKCSWDDGENDKVTMDLIYGTPVHNINMKWMRSQDGPYDDDDACRTPSDWWHVRLWQAFINSEDLWPSCPYIGEIPAEEMVQPYDKDVATLIEDKVVVYGARLTGMGDLYETPAHGLQPGARIHAVALDNLFLYGPKEFKKAQLFETEGIVNTLPTIVVALLIVSFMGWAFRVIDAREATYIIKVVRRFGVLVLSFGFLALICLVFYRWFNLTPVNWIGLMAVLTIMWSGYGKHVPDMVYRVGVLSRLIKSSPALKPQANPSNGDEK